MKRDNAHLTADAATGGLVNGWFYFQIIGDKFMDTLRYWLVIPTTTLAGVLGFALGGYWVWLGIATFPVLLLLDVLLPRDFAVRRIGSPLLADAALYAHCLLLLAMYVFFVLSVAHGSMSLNSAHGTWFVAGSIASLAWLSAVPNLPVAHELMHRRHWFPRRVAQLVGTFYGDPNRDIAHVKGHHLDLDTPADSDTANRGELIHTFIFRASYGAYAEAVKSEAQRLRRMGLSPWHWSNRTYQEIVLLALVPVLCGYFAGAKAVAVVLASMVIAKALVEAFNYFQHYGLLRVPGAPIARHHAWNHMGSIVRPLGVEITNHINHHVDGHTPFYALKPEPEAPQMPSLFICFLTGIFFPPLWFSLIAKPRLAQWDSHHASEAERKLAEAANQRAGWA
ncbi:alkane 1-monooxygenase [Burkholderia vietnamiensis]|uniref:alkane 1-monooxygenase n=1 Tax=Burkholderia vietnamiensis TaxID=60552 RepID=UPI00264D4FCE|nr:alkane 1-monooxygenase [Burkholderia vietnamiensis]MDN8071216.1 alkane 1-monooxygenase [Burkholderia vietnamiensis]